MSIQNPTSNPIIQALLDIKAVGVKTDLVDQLLESINDPQIMHDLQMRWNRHAYPDRSISFVKMGINPGLLDLPSMALRILIVLGQLMCQTGMISVTSDDLAELMSVRKASVLEHLKLLENRGFLAVVRKGRSHQPAVYVINPVVLTVGHHSNQTTLFQSCKKNNLRDSAYPDGLIIETVTSRQEDGSAIRYNKVYIGQHEKSPQGGHPAGSSAPKTDQSRQPQDITIRPKSSRHQDQIDGQMTIEDFLDNLPQDPRS